MKHLFSFLAGGVAMAVLIWFSALSQPDACQQVLNLDERDHAVKSATIKRLMENYDRVIQRNEKLRLQLASLKPLDKIEAEVHQIHTLVERAQPAEQAKKQEPIEERRGGLVTVIAPPTWKDRLLAFGAKYVAGRW